MSGSVESRGETNVSDEATEHKALFPGLVYNEMGEPAEVTHIGGVAHYAIPDGDFMRHVEADKVDNAIIATFKEQITSMQDQVVRGVLELLGKDDIFTKAAIDASIRNMENSFRQGDPNQWVPSLRLLGFRVVTNVHGEVVEIIQPTVPGPEED